jgi:alpha-glucosidase/alpha-D-xyloside xylohydrolase
MRIDTYSARSFVPSRRLPRGARILMGGLAVFAPLTSLAAPLKHAGEAVRLTLAKVSDRTLEVRLQRAGEETFVLPADATAPGLPREILWQGTELDAPLRLTFGDYRCELSAEPLKLEIQDSGGAPVQSLRWDADGKTFGFQVNAPVFGLGGGGPGFDRRGEVFPMKDGWGGYKRESHGIRVAAPYLVSPQGWSLFFNHLPGQLGEFDLRRPEAEYRPAAEQAALPFDLFVALAKEPAALVEERSVVEGRVPLPPKWALGFMQSHRTLAGPDEVMGVAKTFRERRLPCDALIYLGTGYCPAGWNRGHGSLDFNPAVFDRPGEMLRKLHDLKFKVVLHANEASPTLKGETLQPDGPDSIGEYWAKHLPAFSLGADAWWPDDGDPLSSSARLVRHRMYDLGPKKERPNERPWALHRTGVSGVQKFGGWMWSGDPASTWAALRAHVAVGLNHSLSLSPFWGSDTGGFFTTREYTAELFLRWFQFSCFTPSFRSHGRTWHLHLPWGWNTGDRGPLEMDDLAKAPALEDTFNPGVEPICRKYLELRYRLLSYNYALAREASVGGLPMMRPLWLHAPGDAEALKTGDQFFWGENVLVAPVLKQGATERSVYLPAGEWFDFWTGKAVAGGKTVKRSADLATLPLYLKAGSILPLDPVRQFAAEKSKEPLVIRIYPGRDGEFTLYQDDGQSLAYRKGASRTTRISWSEQDKKLRFEPQGSSSFEPDWPREIRIESPEGKLLKSVPWKGKALEVELPR